MIPSSGCPPWPPDHPRTQSRTGNPTPPPGARPQKSVSTHWEFMFTRSMFGTADIAEQGRLLNEVSRLVDEGTLKTTFAESFGTISAANLRRAHALIESGRAKGKIVLQGWA